MKKEVIKVEGMSCNHCKMSVETAVKKIAGVVEAEVNLAEKTLQVEYDNEKTDMDRIRQAVEDVGFEAV
jgi:copper chaperone